MCDSDATQPQPDGARLGHRPRLLPAAATFVHGFHRPNRAVVALVRLSTIDHMLSQPLS